MRQALGSQQADTSPLVVPPSARVCRAACLSQTKLYVPARPLLRFSGSAAEAAFLCEFHRVAAQQELLTLLTAAPLTLASATKPLAAGDWATVAVSALESACFVLLYLLARRRSEPTAGSTLYRRHRSWLLPLQIAVYPLSNRLRAPHMFTPGPCPGPLVYWLREAVLNLSSWLTLIGQSLRLPLQRAAWVQAALVAAVVANAEQRRQVSMRLCPAGAERYRQLASGLTLVSAFLVPPPLGELLLSWQHRLTPALSFHTVDLFFHLLLSYAAVLLQLHRWEVAQRHAFARQQGLAAEAAALQGRRQKQRSAFLAFPAATLLWLLCVGALLSLSPLTFLGGLDAESFSTPVTG
ncbi:hypothetical protein ABPG75_005035 [Micractinium tetrahymenae]